MTYVGGMARGARFGIHGTIDPSVVSRMPAGAWTGPRLGRRTGPHASSPFETDFRVVDVPRDKAVHHRHWRHLTLTPDEAHGAAVLVVDTESTTDSTAVYRVTGGAGEPLARITRRRGSVLKLRRTSWRVEVVGGPELRAKKGGAFAWSMWWLFSPVWLVMAIAIPFGGEFPRMPLRTRWREGGESVLEFSDDSLENSYDVVADRPDARVPFAIALLHFAHPTVLGKNNRP